MKLQQTAMHNRAIRLASRPIGEPKQSDFSLDTGAIPEIQEGEVLLRTVYLSLDPYMRGRMSSAKSYAAPLEIGDVILGGTVSRVVKSLNPKFKEGEWVSAYSGWQDYAVSNGENLISLGDNPKNPSYVLGVLGMPGFTGYMGLLDIGKPQKGETLVVAAATGPVGSVVGQVGKIKGCYVVGIAGGKEKCDYAVNTLGFDVCLDHKAEDFEQQLQKACPKGIDIYFENVGGKVFDAVLPLFNMGARIPLCGLISQYNQTDTPMGEDRLPLLMRTILSHRMTVKGFIVFDDYAPHFMSFLQEMTQWIEAGKIQYKEQVMLELAKAPEAFIGLLRGQNFGKLVIQVGEHELADGA